MTFLPQESGDTGDSKDSGISGNGNEPPETSSGLWQFRQLALQCAAAFIVASLAWPWYGLRGEPPPWPETAFAIGIVALLIATLTRQAWWWRLIHAGFAPLLWKINTLAINPHWHLLGFVLLLIFYRSAPGKRIPLYFSNRTTGAALAEIIEEFSHAAKSAEAAETASPPLRIIDLGAGIGSLIRPLAQMLPHARLCGIENAPAAWLIGYLASRGLGNCAWRWGNFWRVSLSEYNIAYAFLSPEPMPALWLKIRREMRPGSLFISNSFAVPDVPPDEIVELDDKRQTRLYLYRL